MTKNYKVPVKLLKNECNYKLFNFSSTKDIKDNIDIIGQDRAMSALKFGLSIKRKGYNIFVTGVVGTGRTSYSEIIAKEFADDITPPDDWCYVYNFKKADKPKAIRLANSKGKEFNKDMKKLISKIRIAIPEVLKSKDYDEKKNIIFKHFEKLTDELIDKLNEIAIKYNFKFQETDSELISYPLKDDKIMTEEDLENLTEEEILNIKENSAKLNTEGYDIIKKLKDIDIKLKNKITQLKEKVILNIVQLQFNKYIEKYKENGAIKEYLIDMEDDIIKNFNKFINKKIIKGGEKLISKTKEDFFTRYEVNLFIDNSSLKGAPVIREVNPNYYNLLGKIEYVDKLGALRTDHTRIKPGCIHEANGGFLILHAKDLLRFISSWDGLKRTLISGKIRIENITKTSIVSETIKPEEIPLNLKIILIGDNYLYQLLYHFDDDFKKLFRIRADFDVEIDRNENNTKKIALYIAKKCNEENLKAFDKTAIAKIVEYSSRLSEDQNKLTAKFNNILEIMYEADEYCTQSNSDIISAKDVVKAIEEKNFRNNKVEEKIQELIKNGSILIETEGYEVGQINGLAVLDLGQYAFGKPSKITATTFVGKDGIMNIEREVEQSGTIHDKGVLILGGFLGSRFAKTKPLSLSASITFEQSYSVIDGDSASSTELYAILSSLSEIPINQAIAVTGSVNQKGIVQPIGGVNEKIEGYYKTCKVKGFSGGEGVIIPHQNIKNLMLCEEVITAVKEGKFSIYAVENIDEGIEILTGVKAGILSRNGNYKPGTINYLVQKKLERYANYNKEYE